jgi:hypothetical protein
MHKQEYRTPKSLCAWPKSEAFFSQLATAAKEFAESEATVYKNGQQ